MGTSVYLKKLVEEIHSTTVATIGADGCPQTRVIDMMLWDDKGVYFLTAKGKEFYQQIMEQQFMAVSATKDKSIDMSGKPAVINQSHCLHCGRCSEICPKQIIEKRG